MTVVNVPADGRLLARLRRFANGAAVVTMAAGGLVLLGWALDIVVLKALLAGLVTMKPLTALGFVASGTALVLLHGSPGGARRRLGLLFAALVAALGAVVILEYALRLDLGLDQWLFGAAVRAEGGLYPGRPAPTTALVLLLSGGHLLAYAYQSQRLSLALAVPTIAITLLAAVGYAYGVPALYTVGPYTPMALHTALLALLLVLGLLAAQPENPLTAALMTSQAGGTMARGLLPAVVLLPIAFGWLRVQGQRQGLFAIEFGQALVSTANILVFGGLILWNARLLNRTEAQHDLARAALAESEERFRLLADATPNGLLMVAADGHIVLANRQAEALFGHARGGLLGLMVDQLVPERFRGAHRAHRGAYLAHAQVRLMGAGRDLYGCRLDGSEFPVEIGLSPLTTSSGRFTLASIIDITTRKEAEREILNLNATLEHRVLERTAELAANEAKLRALFEVLPVGVSILNQQRQMVESNPALSRILRLRAQDLTPAAFVARRYLHPDGRPFAPHEFASARAFEERQTILNVETGVVTESGDTIWTSVSAAPLAVADMGAVVVTSDITEHRRLVADLLRERDLMQALMDNVPDTIYFKDTLSRFTRINRAQARLLGLPDPASAVGKTDADFLAQGLAHAGLDAEEQRLFQSGQPIVNRIEYNPTPDGQPRWFSATKVPIIDAPSGQVTGLVGISRDITQRKAAEAALEEANQKLTHWVAELEQRNREISLLSQLGSLLQACSTRAEAYGVIAQVGQLLYPHEAGWFGIINPTHDLVEVMTAWGSAAGSPAFAPHECWALRRARVHVTELGPAAEADSALSIMCQHVPLPQPEATVCIPLMSQGEALGVLTLRAEPGSGHPSRLAGAAAQQLVQAVADHVALALGNLKLQESLREQSLRDPLTGLFNRRYLEEWLDREVLRAERDQHAIGLMLIDLDHFKSINDTFGHEAGDLVLKNLADYFLRFIRGGDVACRLGGEEFVLVLPEASLAATGQRAEQLRHGIKHLPLAYHGAVVGPLTASIGVAAYPDNGATTGGLLRVADIALYRAKDLGRDQVVVGQ